MQPPNNPKDLFSRRYLVPVWILTLVWCIQVTLTQTSNLTPWKGGGFGMFSVIDSRTISGKITTKSGALVNIDFSSVYNVNNRLLEKAKKMPTKATLCRLANLIQQHRIYVTPFNESRLYGNNFIVWLKLNQSRQDQGLAKSPLPEGQIAVLESNRHYSNPNKQNIEISQIQLQVHNHLFQTNDWIIHQKNIGPEIVWRVDGCKVSP